MSFWVYMMASDRNGTIYTGHTDDLTRRTLQHRAHSFGGFTAKYEVTRLVWFEEHETRESAFQRERRIKKWLRTWKKKRIEWMNPGWEDLLDRFDGRTGDPEAEARRFLLGLGIDPDAESDEATEGGEGKDG